MSYLFFLIVGVLWGIGCGYCDSRGFMRNDRVIMQILCAVVAYAATALLFLGVPEGGLWFIHLIEVVVLSGVLHNLSRNWFAPRG